MSDEIISALQEENNKLKVQINHFVNHINKIALDVQAHKNLLDENVAARLNQTATIMGLQKQLENLNQLNQQNVDKLNAANVRIDELTIGNVVLDNLPAK